jgi:hypothetical protein
MATKALSSGQLAKLSELFGDRIADLEWRRPTPGESEPTYTGAELLPSVSDLMSNLDTPGLVVRADGGVPTRPVSLFGVEFYPDLEIAYFDARSLAVEVKFIRGADGTGSISKALGQALVYRAGGYPHVHVVLIDCRPKMAAMHAPDMYLPSGVVAHWIRPD